MEFVWCYYLTLYIIKLLYQAAYLKNYLISREYTMLLILSGLWISFAISVALEMGRVNQISRNPKRFNSVWEHGRSFNATSLSIFFGISLLSGPPRTNLIFSCVYLFESCCKQGRGCGLGFRDGISDDFLFTSDFGSDRITILRFVCPSHGLSNVFLYPTCLSNFSWNTNEFDLTFHFL